MVVPYCRSFIVIAHVYLFLPVLYGVLEIVRAPALRVHHARKRNRTSIADVHQAPVALTIAQLMQR